MSSRPDADTCSNVVGPRPSAPIRWWCSAGRGGLVAMLTSSAPVASAVQSTLCGVGRRPWRLRTAVAAPGASQVRSAVGDDGRRSRTRPPCDAGRGGGPRRGLRRRGRPVAMRCRGPSVEDEEAAPNGDAAVQRRAGALAMKVAVRQHFAGHADDGSQQAKHLFRQSVIAGVPFTTAVDGAVQTVHQ